METSALGHAVRESSLWTYPIVNLAHVLGVATLFGSVLVLDLRLLGCWRQTSIAAITGAAVPVATAGFLVAVCSGTGLLAANATAYANNPLLLVKFPAIALGLVNVAVARRLPAWRAHAERALSSREERQLAVVGGISLACWVTAIAAGRLIAYW